MIKWIKRHKVLTITLAVFVILCIILSLSYTRDNSSSPENKIRQGNAAVSSPATNVVTGIKSGVKGLLNFRKTERENQALKEKIDELEREVVGLTLKQGEMQELRELSAALNYDSISDRYTPVVGNVVAFDRSSFFNIFTIDKGTESGIKKNCVVLSGNGLVGRVLETGEGFSKIISIIDEDVNISFQILRDSSIMGMVSGADSKNLKGFTFDGDAGVIEGDIIHTTNIGIYPEGIEIGKIIEVDYDNDIQLKTITVEPSASFKNMKRVVVLVDEI
ncbi:MAG: rod shape-determining protein MreC [Eubacteriales bacterium]|nr:rod shape-determining protein MreC [Eubacteriales bacterium]MDD4390051.1 rod shape-determining protein MreC [Eubacteriales bacterium]